ncbi:MAG: hypothetical protein FWG98_12940 [Candidatus Cloacimonetes bacterium]|nr:hypothetical protein [Candidatus Cloacimonadota bacterium]
MANNRDKSKLCKRLSLYKAKIVVLTSLLMLTMLGLFIGCSNSITNRETEESPYMQMQSMEREQFWFVELYEHIPQSRPDILEEYLRMQGDNLDLEELANFIAEHLGNYRIFYDCDEPEDFEISLHGKIKDKTVIKLSVVGSPIEISL